MRIEKCFKFKTHNKTDYVYTSVPFWLDFILTIPKSRFVEQIYYFVLPTLNNQLTRHSSSGEVSAKSKDPGYEFKRDLHELSSTRGNL